MDLDTAIDKSLQKMGLINDFKLKPQQEHILKHFISGSDCLGVFPTSYGKSLIYQMAPFVYRFFTGLEVNYCCIVISPINSLTLDQIQSCKKLNLVATKIEMETIVLDLADSHLIYSTPEMLMEECHR